jgi:serine/threonine protein kinase
MTFSLLPAFIGKYNFGQTIGKGSFSLVKVAQNTETRAKFAVKIIPKSNMNTAADMERFEREVNVVIKMSHPGIIKIHDFLVDDNYFFLIMDFCGGGTLLSQTGVRDINEERAKPLFKQILEAIEYIHSQGIAHRDLKLENVLMDEFGHIKIIDFGFSRFADPGQMFATPCGSPAYAAPEVVCAEQYDGRMADIWSLGVMLFALITGEFPWKGTNQIQIFNQIKNAKFDVPEGVSKFGEDLIRKLLVPEPNLRLSAAEALIHPWFDGVIVSWGNDNKLRPVLSINTFQRILSSNEKQSMSPRSQLQALGGRRSTTRTAGVSVFNGPLSFGNKAPSPIFGAVQRQSTLTAGLKKNQSKSKIPSLFPATIPDEDI